MSFSKATEKLAQKGSTSSTLAVLQDVVGIRVDEAARAITLVMPRNKSNLTLEVSAEVELDVVRAEPPFKPDAADPIG